MTARPRLVAAICFGVLTIVMSGGWLDRVVAGDGLQEVVGDKSTALK
jgi:hypothetical protein